MSKSTSIPPEAAKDLAKKYGQGMVIIISNVNFDYDGMIEVVKYGKTHEDEAAAILILQRAELDWACSNLKFTKKCVKRGK